MNATTPPGFSAWWHAAGSALPPTPGEDAEAHARRVACAAFEAARRPFLEPARLACEYRGLIRQSYPDLPGLARALEQLAALTEPEGEAPADLAALVLEASALLDPHRQSVAWPDPLAWDGRPLRAQAADLLVLLEAAGTDDARRLAQRLRLAAAASGSQPKGEELEPGNCDRLRVNAPRLLEALRAVLPYAEARAEDLDEARAAGREDPAFPGAAEAWQAVEEARAAITAAAPHLAAPI